MDWIRGRQHQIPVCRADNLSFYQCKKSNYELVKEMMSQSEVYVYEDDKMIQGFVGLNAEYIEGIFVSDEM